LGFSYTGAFKIAVRGGSVLRGSVTGEVEGAPPDQVCQPGEYPSSLDLTLHVRRGTLRFANVRGSIALTGTWCSQVYLGVFGGPISGSLLADLARSHGPAA
jgi:hypothetical protein